MPICVSRSLQSTSPRCPLEGCFDSLRMSEDDRIKWDERYASRDYQPRSSPSVLIETAIELIPPGRALVLACGAGRNAIRLAQAGFEVEGVDISAVAIEAARTESKRLGLDVHWRVADIDSLRLEPGTYDLITMIRYLNRDFWSQAFAALRTDGWLLMEQHFRTRHDVLGPSDPAYRLEPGELLQAFPGLRVVLYSEMVEHIPERDRPSATASLLGCRGNPGW